MNKKEIIIFLEEIIKGVRGKRTHLEEQVEKYGKLVQEGRVTREESQKNMDLLQSFQSSLDHVEGQLYEANYILEKITRKYYE